MPESVRTPFIDEAFTRPKEMTVRKFKALLVVAAATATALAAPTAAAAGTAVAFKPTHALTAHAAKHGFNINGFNWGGYAATGSGFASVTATWTEPTATCNSTNDLYAPWVGIDGYGSSTVEQTGVATDCSSGHAVYQAWYEMYPANPVYLSTSTNPVSPGDSISASVTYAGSSNYTLKLVNNTRGWTFTTTKRLRSAKRLSAEVIIESPTAAYPNFGTISFTNCTVNGSAIGNFSPVAMDPSNSSGYEAHANALTGGGTAFTMNYLHE